MPAWALLDNALSAVTPAGESYWPDRWPLDELMRIKERLDSVDLRAWSSQYMNEIVPAESTMFFPDEWPIWSALPPTCRYVQAWDPAVSEKQTADFSAGACMAFDHLNNIYIVDGRHGRWEVDALEEKMIEFGTQWRPLQVGIEAVAFQLAIVQQMLRKTMLPIKPLQTAIARTGNIATRQGLEKIMNPLNATLGHDKVSRARLLQTRASAGKVYRPANYGPWWMEMKRQLTFFPHGGHDDYVDVLAYCAHMCAGLGMDGWTQEHNDVGKGKSWMAAL